MRPNSRLMKATLTGALGGLLYGFDTVVISGMIDPVSRLYGLSPHEIGITVAASPVGTIVGSFAAGVIGQRLGARAALRLAAALYLMAALAAACSDKLAHAAAGALRRRTGHRRRIRARPGLYRGTGARRAARSPGGLLPDQRGLRHPGGLHLQLPGSACPRRQLCWRSGLARHGRRRHSACLHLLHPAAQHSPLAALAGRPRPQRRSPHGVERRWAVPMPRPSSPRFSPP